MLLLICGMSIASTQPMQANDQSKAKGIAATMVVIAGIAGVGIDIFVGILLTEKLAIRNLHPVVEVSGCIGIAIVETVCFTELVEIVRSYSNIAYKEFSK